jgi:hypothetical protein
LQNNPLQAYASPFFAPNSAQMLPQWFQSVDTDRSGKISVPELQVRGVHARWPTVNISLCSCGYCEILV